VVVASGFTAHWLTRNRRAASARLRAHPVGRVFAGWTGDGRGPHFISLNQWPQYLATSQDESDLYTAGVGPPSELAIIDAGTETVKQTIPLPAAPRRLAVAGRTLCVALADGRVLLRDGSGNTRFVRLGRSIGDIAVSLDGQSLHAAVELEGIRKLDLKTGAISSLPATACPEHVALTPDGKQLVVNYQCGGPRGRSGHDTLEIFDLATWKAVRTITGMPNVGGVVAVTPDGNQIWADGLDACSRPDYDHAGCPAVPAGVLHVIRSSDGNVVRTLPEGSLLAFLPDSSRAVVVGGSETLVLDTTDFIAEETLPSRLAALVLSRTRKRAYAAVTDRKAVAAFDLAGGAGAELLGVVAHWPGDGNTMDIVSGTPGTLQNGAGYGKGMIGAAFQFEGNGAFANLPGPLRVSAPNGDVTLDLWLKPTGAPRAASVAEVLDFNERSRRICALRLTGEGRLLLCGTGSRADACAADSAGSLTGRTRLQPGTWFHVAAVWHSLTGSLWLNGRLDAAGPVQIEHVPVGSLLLGGGEPAAGAFGGWIDEVELYARALSPAEIARLYQTGQRGECLR
jgi:DNA-binding beta-propeller fold protein YncE